MSYCTLADVEGRLRGPALSSASTPTQAEAVDMIDDVGAEIDAALASHGLTVPLASPAGFVAWLAAVNADGAAASVLTARFADDRGPNSNTAAARWERRYQAALARLWDGSAIPGELITGAASALPTSYTVKYPSEPPTMGANATSAMQGFEL